MKLFALAFVTLSSLSLSVLPALSAPTASSKQEFNLRIVSEPPTLDWSLASDGVSIGLLQNLMEGLASFESKNGRLSPKPGLAANWDISKDGKTYTYHLRSGASWSDGTPVTAQQFWDAWERALSPKTASEYAYFLFDVVGAKDYAEGKLKDSSKLGFKALDPATFQVTLNKRAAYFSAVPTCAIAYPIRKDLIEKYGNHWTDPGKMVTTGPFILSEWKHDAKVVLSANDKYWGGRPKLNTVTAYVINEDTTAINMFESGRLQYVSRLPSVEIDRLKSSPAYRQGPYLRGYYYGFNVTKKPFQDVRVRQAFAYAVDRSQITTMLKGGQLPTASWIPKGLLGFDASVGLDFNLGKAQKLLAEAGYPEGKGFPAVTFVFDTRDDHKLIAERLQAMWKKNLGVDLKAQNEDWKVYLNRLRTESPALFRLGWGADYADPDNFMALFTSYSGNNSTEWKNREYDRLVEDAAGEANPKKREALYHHAQELLLEKDAVIIPLFQETLNVLVSPQIKKLELNAMDILMLKDAYLE